MARMASGRLFQRREAALHSKMPFLPAYVVCIVEPPVGERPRNGVVVDRNKIGNGKIA